jgi:hypothetical protein
VYIPSYIIFSFFSLLLPLLCLLTAAAVRALSTKTGFGSSRCCCSLYFQNGIIAIYSRVIIFILISREENFFLSFSLPKNKIKKVLPFFFSFTVINLTSYGLSLSLSCAQTKN